MTWHPTTNLIQTELLTSERLDALKAWPHGIEGYLGDGVWSASNQIWRPDRVYRGKPAPVVTSWWLNVYGGGVSFRYESRSEADFNTLPKRIDVLRIDTCNGVSTAHLEGLKDE
jgi:hypothetical protein